MGELFDGELALAPPAGAHRVDEHETLVERWIGASGARNGSIERP